MRVLILPFVLGAALLAACGRSAAPQGDTASAPFVKTAVLSPATSADFWLSGTARARVESPLSFQVAGRIATRLVDAGQTVKAGQPLFELDARDLEQGVRAAEADLAAAKAALATENLALTRNRELKAGNIISAQSLERAEQAWQEAKTRHDAASSRLAQARNARAYAHLTSPAAGVLMDVTGEAGQVVAAGQTVARLAQAGEREIEVYFPEGGTPPEQGEALLDQDERLPLKLREVAGAVDVQGRTLRARYTVVKGGDHLVLGAVVRTHFAAADTPVAVYSVPVAALDERGTGSRVWRLDAGRVQPVPVKVLSLDDTHARITGPLAPGQHIVALGTQLLVEKMAVRELAQ